MYLVLILGFIVVISLYHFPLKNSHADSQIQKVAKPIKIQREDAPLPQFDPSLPGMQENPQLSDSPDRDDLENALKNAPDGLQIANLFQLGTFQGNQAKIININSLNTNKNSILQVTDAPNQLGAIWGNVSAGNYIDISKNQTLSMWLYFGKRNLKYENIGDGMAFVLQNGGTDAISTFHRGLADQQYGYGESLGVWGTDFDPHHDISLDNFVTTSIQKSFAIEFDTFRDHASASYIDGKGNNFDQNIPGTQHIAMGYPDLSDTYEKRNVSDPWSSSSKLYFFIMMHGHDAKRNVRLTDGFWHHITIDYEKVDDNYGNLSYSFDDKNYDGTQRSGSLDANQTLDISHFKLDSGNTKLRWGFTGSTGKYFENNLISFESVPSFVNGKVETSLFDKTQKKDISSTNKNVSTGDELTFKYKLLYLSGIKPWENTEANITIPDEVTAKSIDIHYADNSIVKVPIDATKHYFKFNLSNALRDHDPNNPHAVISVHTTVNPVDQDTTVKAEHSRFKSKYLIEDAESPDFNIKVANLNLQVIPPVNDTFLSVQSVPKDLAVGYRVWERNPNYPSDIKIYSSVNGNSETETIPTYTQQNQINSLLVDGSQFHFGVNYVNVYAKDNDLLTPIKTIKFFVSGTIEFGQISKSVSFNPITSKSSDKLIERRNDWKVQVIDSRWLNTVDSQKNKWELQVQASPLLNGNSHRFNGQMIFKDHNGTSFALDAIPRTIFYGSKTNENTQTFDVTDSWLPNSGILLKQNGASNDGVYHSKLTWMLVDGPK